MSETIDTTKAHPARVYDVLLGGEDHFPVDRAAAAAALAANPRGYLDVRHNRDFMRRAVTRLAAEDGIRQFLDIGTGLPTGENIHQIAQRIVPTARVVYVDHDPAVLAQARALLTSGPEGRTDYVDADLREPARILEQAARTLDFGQPVALCLVAILHFVPDEEAYPLVRELVAALPSGSRLVLTHLTDEMHPEPTRAVQRTYTERGFTFVFRSRADVERFFTDTPGLTPDEPGVVPVHRWNPGPAPAPPAIAPEEFEALDDIGRIRYRDINDVTDDDINVYGATGTKA
ncbi:SAM-dependent methyltransferase [Streptomyces sp. NPDC014995]|uniref:SAM-dependent methyltransferase n=1 Tax=Streptomyces sp. NPDC014995 TaxID=3364936 RepID=UPI0036FA35F4